MDGRATLRKRSTHEEPLLVGVLVRVLRHHHAPVEARAPARVHVLPAAARPARLVEQLVRPAGDDARPAGDAGGGGAGGAAPHEVPVRAVHVAAAVEGGLVPRDLGAGGGGAEAVGVVGCFPRLGVTGWEDQGDDEQKERGSHGGWWWKWQWRCH